MADARLLFPHDYLSAADLRGRDVPMTIARVIMDDLKTDRGTEKKPVILFEELEKKRARGETCPHKWVLNKTCAKSIAKAIGTWETDEWVGKRIALFPTTCLAFGQQVDCIRVREKAPPPPRGRKPEPEPPPMLPDDEADPFGEEAADAAQ